MTVVYRDLEARALTIVFERMDRRRLINFALPLVLVREHTKRASITVCKLWKTALEGQSMQPCNDRTVVK